MNKMNACWAWGKLATAGCVVAGLTWFARNAKAADPTEPAKTDPAAQAGVSPEVTADPFLFEVVRHVYRWHLDEGDFDRLSGAKTFPFWVRMLHPNMDADDRSQFAEIVMPMVGTSVIVKKTDYRIEELNLEIKGGGFRINSVSKIGVPDQPRSDDQVVNADYAAMKEYLFKTRDQASFPEGELLERFKGALRAELKVPEGERASGRQIAYLAPMSPVANEVWVFWENRKMLIRFASDIDLTNPEVWGQDAIRVRTWDTRTQVVVSLDEAAGSNAFATRDQVGRALFNCVVLGKRMETENPPQRSEP